MPRPTGRRNTDFEAKRVALARRAREEWLQRGAGVSLRELAESTGSSLTNLKHYFGDRDGLVEAISEVCQRDSASILSISAEPVGDNAREALFSFFERLLIGWHQFGVGRLHEVGLAEGLGDPRKGPAFVNHILEPSLQTAERLLQRLIDKKQLPRMELRGAALTLMAPVVLALLHQDGLRGNTCRPLDVRTFVRTHVDHWLDGWAPD